MSVCVSVCLSVCVKVSVLVLVRTLVVRLVVLLHSLVPSANVLRDFSASVKGPLLIYCSDNMICTVKLQCVLSWSCYRVVVWLSGNIVGQINKVALRRAGLVLRWVTVPSSYLTKPPSRTQPGPLAAICHISLGSRPEATSLPSSILLSFLPLCGLLRGSGQSQLTRCQTFRCNLCSQTALSCYLCC